MVLACSAFCHNFAEQKFVFDFHLDAENSWLEESCAPNRSDVQAQAHTAGQNPWYESTDLLRAGISPAQLNCI